MRVALFIIVGFLGTLAGELTTMPKFWVVFLTGIAGWGLASDYLEFKKREKINGHN